MATPFKLPELGENIETAQIVKVLVEVGDEVAADQPLFEAETNKATVEVPADGAGVVTEVHVSEGDEVSVGSVLLMLGDAGEVGEPAEKTEEKAAPEEKPPAAPEEDTAPEPAPAEQPAPDAERQAGPEPSEKSAPAPAPPASPPTGARVPAAPSVRKFARELGLDIARVTGSGPQGRVSVEDVKRYAKRLHERTAVTPPVPGTTALPPLPNFEKWGPVEREKMSNIRRVTAEHLTHCWSQIAHVTQFDRADITELDVLRKKYADRAAKQGGKLTMAVMVVKIAAAALKVFPRFNASVDMPNREIVLKKFINVGIAVSAPHGLLVPVLRDVDRKNMVQIAVEASEIAAKARDGKVSLEELQGGTFTVTNLGSIGGTHFTPIVNYPEVAILGMGRAYTEPGYNEQGEIVPRTLLPLSLSYDHRIIDGADGARFLRWVVEAIEQPLLLALEG